MLIGRLNIRGFRCLEDVSLDLDHLTALIGANGAGKSSVLHALDFFFNGMALSHEDVCSRTPDADVSVRVTFTDITDADRSELGAYAIGTSMTLVRRWSHGQEKLTGRGRRFSGFAPVRGVASASDKRRAYAELRRTHLEWDLPSTASAPECEAALLHWEQAHDDQCEDADVDATHLFGIAGQGKLGARFRFVHVPAVREAADETREGRATVLGRLLSAIADQRSAAQQEVAAFGERMRQEYEQIVAGAHNAALAELSSALTTQLRTFVADSHVELNAEPGALSLPVPAVSLRAGEHDELSDIGRQGHGFQRAFLIATLQLLAQRGPADESAPTILLAIEEPELYQHPVRARSLSRTLARLMEQVPRRVQVCYTTHSPYLVDAARFERLRLLRRGGSNGPLRRVSRAREADVAARLNGIIPADEITRRLSRTMNVAFNEAFFARAVILCEGPTDAAALMGTADRLNMDLDMEGVAILPSGGKTSLAIQLAILDSLEVPTHTVFDGDAACDTKDRSNNARQNGALQQLLGVTAPVAFPSATAADRYTCIRENLEDYLEQERPGFRARCATISVQRDWREKSPETYRSAVTEFEPTSLLKHAIESALRCRA